MTPLGHILVALLPVATYFIVFRQRLPTPKLVYVAVFGSLFPDLIDKPLAHQFFLIESGREVAHSLVVFAALAVVLFVVLRRHRSEWAVFVFAHLSHIVADFRHDLLRFPPEIDANLLWPLVAPTPSARVPEWAGPGSVFVTLWTVFSISYLLVTLVLCWRELRQARTNEGLDTN